MIETNRNILLPKPQHWFQTVRRKSDIERLLFYVYGLLLKATRFDRGFVSGARLEQVLLRVGDLQPYLVLQLLPAHLRLPNLEFVPDCIRLSHAIP